MFYYLSETVTHIDPIWLSSTAAEWGWCHPHQQLYLCPPWKKGKDKENSLHISTCGEGCHGAHGFPTQEELNLFQQLISVRRGTLAARPVHPMASTQANLWVCHHYGDEGPHLRPGHRQEDRPAGHPGAEDKLGQRGQTINGAGEPYGGTGVTVIPEKSCLRPLLP